MKGRVVRQSDLEWVVTKLHINAKMPPTRLTLGKRHFMSYLFYQVLEFYVMGILYKIEKQIKEFITAIDN